MFFEVQMLFSLWKAAPALRTLVLMSSPHVPSSAMVPPGTQSFPLGLACCC